MLSSSNEIKYETYLNAYNRLFNFEKFIFCMLLLLFSTNKYGNNVQILGTRLIMSRL